MTNQQKMAHKAKTSQKMEKKKDDEERVKQKLMKEKYQAEAEKRETFMIRMKQDRRIFQQDLQEK